MSVDDGWSKGGSERNLAYAAGADIRLVIKALDARDAEIERLERALGAAEAKIERVEAECEAIVTAASIEAIEDYANGMMDAQEQVRAALESP